jgi:hypothetical protein
MVSSEPTLYTCQYIGQPSLGRPGRSRGHAANAGGRRWNTPNSAAQASTLCAAEGIGVIPWNPRARGKLSRDWDYTSLRTETDEAMTRLSSDEIAALEESYVPHAVVGFV